MTAAQHPPQDPIELTQPVEPWNQGNRAAYSEARNGREPQVREGRLCTATNRQGEPCRNHAVVGARVCHLHGGAAPQVKRKAALRLAALVDPAIATLAKELTNRNNKPADRLRAAENILDRAGVPRHTEVDGEMARAILVERLLSMRAQQESENAAAQALGIAQAMVEQVRTVDGQ